MLALTDKPIDVNAVLDAVRTPRAGAVVLFLGTVREITAGRETTALEYEAYPDMAIAQMQNLVTEAAQQWTGLRAAILHRTGHLLPGEISVAIAVSTPHRQQAFEAGKFLIDELKERVPVWKKELWADGSVEWVGTP